MSDHSIIYDLHYPQRGTFVCNASDDSQCNAAWNCECETIWGYRVIGGSPVHDTTVEGAEAADNAIHVGWFDNDQCNLTDWYDNQDECVDGEIRVDVDPVNEFDYVAFTATAARMEVSA